MAQIMKLCMKKPPYQISEETSHLAPTKDKILLDIQIALRIHVSLQAEVAGQQDEIYQKGGIGRTSGNKIPENERRKNRLQALRLILEFDNSKKQFSGSVDDGWKRPLAQFTSLR